MGSFGLQAASSGADDALDWHGEPVDCDACAHRALLAEGRCRKGWSCVLDRRIKHIDRFLRANPELADTYLDHPYFELRAVAVNMPGCSGSRL